MKEKNTKTLFTCVPTSVGTNSMRIAPLAASWVTRALTLLLLGDKTDATQSSLFRVAPGGGRISETYGNVKHREESEKNRD